MIFKNKTGQLDFPIITFVVIIFGLLLVAPIVLKIFNQVNTGFGNALGNMTNGTGGNIAKTNFQSVMQTGINFWDKIIIAVFILSLLLLFISAFLIDTNPFWVILYIFISFMLVLFAGDIISALDSIYNSALFATEVSSLGFMVTLRDHFGEFLVGIIAVTGIIMYGKIALFRGGGQR